MGNVFRDITRLKGRQRSELLDRLDHSSQKPKKSSRRAHQRLTYRAQDVAITISHPGGGMGRFLVCARNLSAGGMSFLHGSFLHTGTEVQVLLTSQAGAPKLLQGGVRSCRHIGAHVHEVGVQFREQIDPMCFCDPEVVEAATREPDKPPKAIEIPDYNAQALCVCGNGLERKLLQHRLTAAGLGVVAVDSIGAALDQIKRLPFDLLVCDLAMNSDDKPIVTEIRTIGYRGPIIGIVEEAKLRDSEADQTGRLSKLGSIIAKPYQMDVLLHHVELHLKRTKGDSIGSGPIYSSIASESGSRELLSFFVNQAKESAGELTNALEGNDRTQLRKVTQSLRSTAAGYGFAPVSEACKHVIATIDSDGEDAILVSQVKRLIDICGRLSDESPPEGQPDKREASA